MDQGVHASNQSRNKYSTALIVFHSSLSLSLSPLEKITFLIGTLYWQPNLAIITHTYCQLLFFFFFHFFNKPTSPLQLKTNYTHTHTHKKRERERQKSRLFETPIQGINQITFSSYPPQLFMSELGIHDIFYFDSPIRSLI